MGRKLTMTGILITLLSPAVWAQRLPEATKDGQEAAADFLVRCTRSGAIKLVPDSGTGTKRILLGDEKALKRVVHEQKKAITPSLRNALLKLNEQSGIVAVIIQVGQEMGDDEAIAFGRLFSARLREKELKYDEARRDYEEASNLFGRLNLLQWKASVLNDFAEFRKDQGEMSEAAKLHRAALELHKKLYGDKQLAVAISLNNLGVVCHALGNLKDARKHLTEALALKQQLLGDRQASVAFTLDNLGLVCRDEGDLPQALKFHQQALDLLVAIYGEQNADVAVSVNNVALAYRGLRDLARAIKSHERALSIRKGLFGKIDPSIAQTLNNLAETWLEQGNLSKAHELHVQALEMRRSLFGNSHPTVATSLNNLAGVCVAQGDLHQARTLLLQSLEINRRIYGERHPDIAATLHHLAVVSHHRHDAKRAVQYAMDSILACRLPGENAGDLAEIHVENLTLNTNTVQFLHDLGWVIEFSADSSSSDEPLRHAATAYKLSADVLDRLRVNVLQTEEGKLFQGAEHAALVPARVRLAAALFDRDAREEDLYSAFIAIEQGRARVFLEAVARARSHQLGGVPHAKARDERELLGRMHDVEGRLQKENAKAPEHRNAKLIGTLFEELKASQNKLDQFLVGLRRDYPNYAALQYPEPCTIDRARACLGDNEVSVLFALDREESYALVLKKQAARGERDVAIVRLPGSKEFAQKIQTLVDGEVLRSDSRCRQLGAELYALLLKPLAPYVGGKDLVLAPDGVLWELPFELLVEGRTGEEGESKGRYLVETRSIRYTPSMTVLQLIDQWEKARQAPAEPLWALGDPVFSQDDGRAKGDLRQETRDLLERYALRGGGPASAWNRLRASGEEVRSIAKLYRVGRDDVVTGVLASERVLKTVSEKDILSRKRYLHLATHGILGVGLGRQPSLVLSLVGNDGAEQLGGANDGFLTMEEVTHIKLNADLVVLSACETGKGDLKAAEGVVGLSRAFLYAGSRGVVCSLWQVDDERCADLMRAMYARLKEGKPAAEALALARRQLIDQEQAPFYWAPFVLLGK
jgi:CHAT domain-containing protein/Tfp pilus assembly protein PilF